MNTPKRRSGRRPMTGTFGQASSRPPTDMRTGDRRQRRLRVSKAQSDTVTCPAMRRNVYISAGSHSHTDAIDRWHTGSNPRQRCDYCRGCIAPSPFSPRATSVKPTSSVAVSAVDSRDTAAQGYRMNTRTTASATLQRTAPTMTTQTTTMQATPNTEDRS